MRNQEEENDLLVVIIDETYDGPEDDYEERSEEFRQKLEIEFAVGFEEANVGPGADIPGFLTTISTAQVPAWTILLAGFFLGKRIKENIEAWVTMARQVRKFFKHDVVLGRHAAASIAVEAVLNEVGGLPKSITLISYRPAHISEMDQTVLMERGNIEAAPETIQLGVISHVFQIEADGVDFKVTVQGQTASIKRA